MTSIRPTGLMTRLRGAPGQEIARTHEGGLPAPGAPTRPARVTSRLWAGLRRYGMFVAVCILPTLVASAYYFLWASDQYASEAKFIIRGTSGGGVSSLLGQMFASASGMHTAQEELMSVSDYLKSIDAVRQLQQRINFTEFYQRPDADWPARLGKNVPAEELLDYYQNKVNVSYDTMTGIMTLRVRAFRPDDAQKVADTLLTLGEELVNKFAERQQGDTLRVAREEVRRAEARVVESRQKLTEFREREDKIDLTGEIKMIMELISKLEVAAAQARTELTEASTYLKPDNQRYVGMRNKVEALERQIQSERKRLTGSGVSLSPSISVYERLMIEREFADKGYASAMLSLENARMEAQKQHMYLIRIVEPYLAEKALYPRRLVILATLLVGSFMIYGIGWLILAGIREHVA